MLMILKKYKNLSIPMKMDVRLFLVRKLALGHKHSVLGLLLIYRQTTQMPYI